MTSPLFPIPQGPKHKQCAGSMNLSLGSHKPGNKITTDKTEVDRNYDFFMCFHEIESDGLLKGRDSYFESHNLTKEFLVCNC